MIVNTNRMPNKYKSKKYTVAFGIQSWLLNQRYVIDQDNKDQVDKPIYKALVKEFCDAQPNYIPTKHIEGKEGFVSKNFSSFQMFCHLKYRDTNIILKQSKK